MGVKSTTLSLATNSAQLVAVPSDNCSVALISLTASNPANILVEGTLDGSTFHAIGARVILNATDEGSGVIGLYDSIPALIIADVAGLVDIQLTNTTSSVTPTGTLNFSTAPVTADVLGLAAGGSSSTLPVPKYWEWAVSGASGSEVFLLDCYDINGDWISQIELTYTGDPSSLLYCGGAGADAIPSNTHLMKGIMTAGTEARFNLAGISVDEAGGLSAWGTAAGLSDTLPSPDVDGNAKSVSLYQPFTLQFGQDGELVQGPASWGTLALIGTSSSTVCKYELRDESNATIAMGTITTGIATGSSLATHVRANGGLTNANAKRVRRVILRPTVETVYINGGGSADPTVTASNGITGVVPTTSCPTAVGVGYVFDESF